jgi:hypothetical protein
VLDGIDIKVKFFLFEKNQGNYEASQVYYEGVLHELNQLIQNANEHNNGQQVKKADLLK